MLAIVQNLNPKTTVPGITPNSMYNLQLGWSTAGLPFTIVRKSHSLTKKEIATTHKQDIEHRQFLICLSQTYHQWLTQMSLTFLTSTKTKNTLSTNSFILPSKIGRPTKSGIANCVALLSKRIQPCVLSKDHGKMLNLLPVVLTMSRTYKMKKIKNKQALPLVQSKRSIDYTWTLTFFPNTMTRTLVLVFYWPYNNTYFFWYHNPFTP